jgi:hypothetical protein
VVQEGPEETRVENREALQVEAPEVNQEESQAESRKATRRQHLLHFRRLSLHDGAQFQDG